LPIKDLSPLPPLPGTAPSGTWKIGTEDGEYDDGRLAIFAIVERLVVTKIVTPFLGCSSDDPATISGPNRSSGGQFHANDHRLSPASIWRKVASCIQAKQSDAEIEAAVSRHQHVEAAK
jgi:hypothetical protein